MKATELLSKKLKIYSSRYGYGTFQIVDFEYINCTFKLYYDSHYNGEVHIYNLSFSMGEMNKLVHGSELVREADGEVTTTTTYKLIN